MTDVNIKNELIKLVSELFQDKGIDPELIEYVDLIDDLGMDSMIFLSVVIELETAKNGLIRRHTTQSSVSTLMLIFNSQLLIIRD